MLKTSVLEFHIRDNFTPRRILSDLLAKRWMEPIVPFSVMVVTFVMVSLIVPGYFSLSNIADISQQYAETGLVAIGLALVIMSGGIDISVGSNFALSAFLALFFFYVLGLPVWLVVLLCILGGAILGAVNGLLIGYLKLRAFMVTLVTMIVYRALYRIANQLYANELAMVYRDSSIWEFIGDGMIVGIPTNMAVLIIIAVMGHFMVSRSRWGWHITAIGGARQAARQAGVPVARVVFFTYVLCGGLTASAAALFAARLNSIDLYTGLGMEFKMVTAVILGGVVLGGGKGSVPRAIFGSVIIFVILNALVNLGAPGDMHNVLIGTILIIAVGAETKWLKNKYRAINTLQVNTAFLGFPNCSDVTRDSKTPFKINNRLLKTEAIGLGQVDGPEDVILDRQNRLYCGSRIGVIYRFSGENFSNIEEFARTGGYPLGMAFDRDDNLIVCVGGMGLYGVHPNGEVYKLTDRTNRTWWRLKDDSWVILADDLDIAPDNKVYFSELSQRYEQKDWAIDSFEGYGNGRLLCYDPSTGKTRTVVRNLLGANGICIAQNGQSVLIAQTWGCNVIRFWLDGPNKGMIEPVIENLPGYPDNINRASDGNYWVALAAIRTPTMDLSMKMPGFRLRMTKRLPPDEWIIPNFNNGCVFKMSAKGEVLDVLWDKGAQAHPAITSMREHRGNLYLGGVFNNRIGRVPIEGANPEWTGPGDYWGNCK